MTQLALVIDLNVCVGCHACVTSCKQWNTSGAAGPLADFNPYGADPTGTFFNRVQTFEIGEYPSTQTVHFPKSCLHCEDPPCVPVCPTGASHVREQDNLVLVNQDLCIGCRACVVACPYQVRFIVESDKGYYDEHTPYEAASYRKWQAGTAQKCTLCVHRIDKGLNPACVETCPTRALIFGDLNDPQSEISKLVQRRAHFQPRAELGTDPCVFYLT